MVFFRDRSKTIKKEHNSLNQKITHLSQHLLFYGGSNETLSKTDSVLVNGLGPF